MLPSACLPTVLLLGDASRLPFVGHLRRRFPRDVGGLTVAARIGTGAPGGADPDMPDLATPYRAARALERTLVDALSTGVSDRHDLLRSLWAAVASVPACDLGRARGADLTLLAVAAD
ncbi:MAG: hypothetical protein GXP62_06745, partial [Oligoflexia bacterium]|nr:hypothetical protein [Oligoflexia bacterium]